MKISVNVIKKVKRFGFIGGFEGYSLAVSARAAQ
jgi:hypothetical protein